MQLSVMKLAELGTLEASCVGVAPGVDFGQAGKRAVRFSYASSEENIHEVARRLGEYLGNRTSN
jgi:aspartate/methionine/tyrosine aminotransferase